MMQELQARLDRLSKLLERIKPIPEAWVAGRSKATAAKGGLQLECLPCYNWRELRTAWQSSGMKWLPILEKAMTVLLACVTSTESRGEQLWLKLVGQPSSGKTTLVEAISVARKYVFPKDTLTKLTSGYQMDKEGSENLSLLESLHNKTFIIQDGDTLLESPNLCQILSQLRAFYGRTLRTQYGNKMSKNHEGINTTIVICGTESLRKLDSSELGERLLDCVASDDVDAETEQEIARRVAYREERELVHKSDGQPETRDSPEMLRAKQLTGGYVTYLRENAQKLLAKLEPTPERSMDKLIAMGAYVSFLRSRPSKTQAETAQRELSYRLVAQHVRLARCLAVVLNKPGVDEEVMERVKAVSMDTARGRTQRIIETLYDSGTVGMPLGTLAHRTNESENEERRFLKHLKGIGAVEPHAWQPKEGVAAKKHWRLTSRMRSVYQAAVFPF